MWFKLSILTFVVIAFGALLVFIGTSVVPHSNPAVIYEVNWDSQETESLVRRACYDCHSNETVYPWYAYVAPPAFLVSRDVIEGRDELNFSTGHKLDLDEMVDVITAGEMPPRLYTAMHPEALFNEVERDLLIVGLKATFMQDAVGARVQMSDVIACTTEGDLCAPAAEATLDPAALMPSFGQPPVGGD